MGLQQIESFRSRLGSNYGKLPCPLKVYFADIKERRFIIHVQDCYRLDQLRKNLVYLIGAVTGNKYCGCNNMAIYINSWFLRVIYGIVISRIHFTKWQLGKTTSGASNFFELRW